MNSRHGPDPVHQFPVERDIPERGREGIGIRQGHAIDVSTVGGSQQNDLANQITDRLDSGIGVGSHCAGVDVSGMGHDNRLRRCNVDIGLIQEFTDGPAQLCGIPGVKHSSH